MSNIAVQREYETETLPMAKRKAAVRIMKGIGASSGVAIGPCRVILRSKDLGALKKGEILVYRTASHELIPHLEGLKGLITEVGGQLTIMAHYARLNEVPHVAGVADVMGTITDGQVIRIDGSKGTVSLL